MLRGGRVRNGRLGDACEEKLLESHRFVAFKRGVGAGVYPLTCNCLDLGLGMGMGLRGFLHNHVVSPLTGQVVA